MSNILLLSSYVKPKLHPNILTMSFENYAKIRKVYNEIIGLDDVDHFSLNIADPQNRVSIFSFNPALIYRAFKEGWYIYNGTLSPSHYKRSLFFAWDECYNEHIRTLNEKRYGFRKGVILVRRIAGAYIMYCFATKRNPEDFFMRAKYNLEKFYSMGDHCFDQLSSIYTDYSVIKHE